jgi:hypothetical protein
VEEHGTDEAMSEFITPLADIGDKVTKLTMEIGMKPSPTPTKSAPPPCLTCAWWATWCSPTSSPAWPRSRWKAGQRRRLLHRQAGHRALLLCAPAAGNRAMLIRQARSGAANLMALDAELFDRTPRRARLHACTRR